MKIAVVIPAYNEAGRIESCLRALTEQTRFSEILVVDGGSSDDTQARARSMGIRVVVAPRGRASQQNRGAAAVAENTDVLLFLHADAQLPRNAAALIQRALANPDVVAGAFAIRTMDDRPEGNNRGLYRDTVAHLLPLADIRSRVSRLPYGDQGLFMRRHIFDRVGGFPDQPLLEDLEISRRLKAVGRIHIIPEPIQVSGRRFLARPVFYTAVVNLFPWLYRAGVSAESLARFYGAVR